LPDERVDLPAALNALPPVGTAVFEGEVSRSELATRSVKSSVARIVSGALRGASR
jgi:hypothetical protein